MNISSMIMKWLVVLTVAIALCHPGNSASIYETREPWKAKCEWLWNFLDNSAFDRARNLKEDAGYVRILGLVNVSKPMVCKIVEAETLRDLADLVPGSDYEATKESYQQLQKQYERHGGYTSLARYAGCAIDFAYKLWDTTRNVDSPKKISDVIDLPSLTRITEVMQVKYGSRWLAMLLYMENEVGLVKDPRKFAKDLFESNSFEDFASRQTEISDIPDDELIALYDSFLNAHKNRQSMEEYLERERFFGEAGEMYGELGLLTLKY